MLYTMITGVIVWSDGNWHGPRADEVSFSSFSSSYCAIIMFFVLQILFLKKDLSSILHIVSVGALFIFAIIVMMIGIGIHSMTNTEYIITNDITKTNVFEAAPNPRFIIAFAGNFSPLAGAFSTGYFLHQLAIPITKNNAN